MITVDKDRECGSGEWGLGTSQRGVVNKRAEVRKGSLSQRETLKPER